MSSFENECMDRDGDEALGGLLFANFGRKFSLESLDFNSYLQEDFKTVEKKFVDDGIDKH